MIENFQLAFNFYRVIKNIHYSNIYKKRQLFLSKRPSKYFMHNDEERLYNLNILSSHNSYLNNYQNFDYADISNLEFLIKLGVRCLEFDVYYIDGKLLVGHGTKNLFNNYDFITTNTIKLEDIFVMIKNIAFKDFSDLPLFINLELLTHNSKEAHQKIVDKIQKYFYGYILHSKFNCSSINIGKCRLKHLRKKIVFITGSRLNEDDPLLKYINAFSYKINEINHPIKPEYILNLSDKEWLNPKNQNIVKKHIKNKGLVRIYPRASLLTHFSANYEFNQILKAGVQFVALNIQQMNAKSQEYLQKFNNYSICKIY